MMKDNFKVMTKEEANEKCELVYIETESGFHIALDLTYMEQVEEFKITLPTGEVIDTRDILNAETDYLKSN